MKYDILVIGFGKAGKTLAAKFSSEGKKVALIEKDEKMYGGTCINIGCIPTKTLLVAAEKGKNYVETYEERNAVVARLNKKNYEMLTGNVDIYLGRAEFVDENTVKIVAEEEGQEKEIQIESDIIIINTGAKARIPNILGIEKLKKVYNSTEIQELKEKPSSIGIIGGGNIGLEFATLYSKLGTKVTIFETGKQILSKYEPIVGELAREYMENQGIEIITESKIENIYEKENKVVVELENEEKEFEILMYAVGREPNIETLKLEKAGVELNEKGWIKIDNYCNTTQKNIYAVGDVNGGPQFTYVSLDDYRIVYGHIKGIKEYDLTKRKNIPTTSFINPPLSQVGLTEKEAKEKGYSVISKEIRVAAMPRGHVNGDLRGVYKAVVDKDTKMILGVTLYGKNSEEVINIIKMAMDNNIEYTYLKNQLFTHPTMAENLNDLFNM